MTQRRKRLRQSKVLISKGSDSTRDREREKTVFNLNRSSSAFPTKVFRMRASILTDLLEVSHIRSIRQIFISILVLLVLQVVITDLFEKGTYVD